MQRKQQIQAKRNEIDIKVYQTMEEKNKKQILKKEQENLKRIERIRTVERIQRQNEYHKKKIEQKIQLDNMKAKALKDQKEDLLEQRRVMQKEAAI